MARRGGAAAVEATGLRGLPASRSAVLPRGLARGRCRVCCKGGGTEEDPKSMSMFLMEAIRERHRVVYCREPSALLPPTTTIEAQMNALQSNDWPEPNAGIQTAFMFAWPRHAESSMVDLSMRRSWSTSKWCDAATFSEDFRVGPYAPMLHCNSWNVESLQFLDNAGLNAKQSVHVSNGQHPECDCSFTFHLRQVSSGKLKGFWMTCQVLPSTDDNI
mmetsp:Transcript_9381/g.24088  ORF Transcript_9381/g.24088 Transcript_9381/m.24088 type:complete len:217 (-) Transcript_9381:37-687(-)